MEDRFSSQTALPPALQDEPEDICAVPTMVDMEHGAEADPDAENGSGAAIINAEAHHLQHQLAAANGQNDASASFRHGRSGNIAAGTSTHAPSESLAYTSAAGQTSNTNLSPASSAAAAAANPASASSSGHVIRKPWPIRRQTAVAATTVSTTVLTSISNSPGTLAAIPFASLPTPSPPAGSSPAGLPVAATAAPLANYPATAAAAAAAAAAVAATNVAAVNHVLPAALSPSQSLYSAPPPAAPLGLLAPALATSSAAGLLSLSDPSHNSLDSYMSLSALHETTTHHLHHHHHHYYHHDQTGPEDDVNTLRATVAMSPSQDLDSHDLLGSGVADDDQAGLFAAMQGPPPPGVVGVGDDAQGSPLVAEGVDMSQADVDLEDDQAPAADPISPEDSAPHGLHHPTASYPSHYLLYLPNANVPPPAPLAQRHGLHHHHHHHDDLHHNAGLPPQPVAVSAAVPLVVAPGLGSGTEHHHHAGALANSASGQNNGGQTHAGKCSKQAARAAHSMPYAQGRKLPPSSTSLSLSGSSGALLSSTDHSAHGMLMDEDPSNSSTIITPSSSTVVGVDMSHQHKHNGSATRGRHGANFVADNTSNSTTTTSSNSSSTHALHTSTTHKSNSSSTNSNSLAGQQRPGMSIRAQSQAEAEMFNPSLDTGIGASVPFSGPSDMGAVGSALLPATSMAVGFMSSSSAAMGPRATPLMLSGNTAHLLASSASSLTSSAGARAGAGATASSMGLSLLNPNAYGNGAGLVGNSTSSLAPEPPLMPEIFNRYKDLPSFLPGYKVMTEGPSLAGAPQASSKRRRLTTMLPEKDLVRLPPVLFNMFLQDAGLTDPAYQDFCAYLREVYQQWPGLRLPEDVCELGCGRLKDFRRILQQHALTPSGQKYLEEERERAMNRLQQAQSRKRRRNRTSTAGGTSGSMSQSSQYAPVMLLGMPTATDGCFPTHVQAIVLSPEQATMFHNATQSSTSASAVTISAPLNVPAMNTVATTTSSHVTQLSVGHGLQATTGLAGSVAGAKAGRSGDSSLGRSGAPGQQSLSPSQPPPAVPAIGFSAAVVAGGSLHGVASTAGSTTPLLATGRLPAGAVIVSNHSRTTLPASSGSTSVATVNGGSAQSR